MTETCTVCRATVVLDRPMTDEEREKFLCEDCHLERMYDAERAERFSRDELPKFKQVIEDFEAGFYTVEEFYVHIAELTEPF